MHTFVIVTTADPRRPGLTYKVEIPDSAVDIWFTENRDVKLAFQSGTIDGANTSITKIDEKGTIQVEEYRFDWPVLHELLYQADYMTAEMERKPGRPEKRALLLTTSKERRTGSLVSRAGY